MRVYRDNGKDLWFEMTPGMFTCATSYQDALNSDYPEGASPLYGVNELFGPVVLVSTDSRYTD